MAKKGKKRNDSIRNLTTQRLLSKEIINMVIQTANLSGNNDSQSQTFLITLSKLYDVMYNNDIRIYYIVLLLYLSMGIDPYSLGQSLSTYTLKQRLYELRLLGYIDKSNKLTAKARKILDALI